MYVVRLWQRGHDAHRCPPQISGGVDGWVSAISAHLPPGAGSDHMPHTASWAGGREQTGISICLVNMRGPEANGGGTKIALERERACAGTTEQ